MGIETTSVGFPTYPRVLPWNQVGKDISEAKTIEEALILGNLEWTVVTEQAFAKLPSGEFVPSPSCRLTVRTDLDDCERLLGYVGPTFRPLQNRQAFDFCGPLVDKGLKFDRCGTLRNGRIVWMVVQLPWSAEIGPDVIQSFLVIRNAHDGSGSLEAMFLPVNMTCQNVLAISSSGKPQKIRLRHTQGGANQLTSANTIYQQADKWWNSSVDVMRELLGVAVPDGVLTEFLLLMYPDKKENGDTINVAAGARAWVHEIYAQLQTQSAYDLWNAVTEYLDHIPTGMGGRGQKIGARMNSLLWGNKAQKRAEAGALLLKMFK